MKYIFWGTPFFSAIILEELIKAGYSPELLICNPDKPVGRKKIISPPETKIVAKKNKIKIFQPEKLDKIFFNQLKKINPDLFIVAAYNKIISKEFLDIPKFGSIGIHPSLLPKYRGPSPIQSVILKGEKETGTTLFLMDEKMDHGPIIAQKKLNESITHIYFEELLKKLAFLSAQLTIETLPKFIKGKIIPKPQNENQATYTKKIKKEDGLITFKESISEIYNKIRAFSLWPGVYFFLETDHKKTRVIIKKAKLKNNKIKIEKIKPEGKKEIDLKSNPKYLKLIKQLAPEKIE